MKLLSFPFTKNFENSYSQTLLPQINLYIILSVWLSLIYPMYETIASHTDLYLVRFKWNFSKSSFCWFFKIITCYWNTATDAWFLDGNLWFLDKFPFTEYRWLGYCAIQFKSNKTGVKRCYCISWKAEMMASQKRLLRFLFSIGMRVRLEILIQWRSFVCRPLECLYISCIYTYNVFMHVFMYVNRTITYNMHASESGFL